MMFKEDLVKLAEGFGYFAELNKKGGQKVQGCVTCRKNTALMFYNPESHQRIAACTCGFRKKLSPYKPKERKDLFPNRCMATTKGGYRCKKDKKDGHDFCGFHLTRDPVVFKK